MRCTIYMLEERGKLYTDSSLKWQLLERNGAQILSWSTGRMWTNQGERERERRAFQVGNRMIEVPTKINY